jgi:glycosyltransferase involved in cell wall biosynthesis
MTISYAITVCNELNEITALINFLHPRIRSKDEIVIQYDLDSVTDEVLEYVELMDKLHSNITVTMFPLDNDFGAFKSNLKKFCKGDYILQLDADELPHELLVENLHLVLEENPVDIIFVPRWNTVAGITSDHLQKWGWELDEHNRINWPDYQVRCYKNTDSIEWRNKVHETLTGYDTFSNFPAEEHWCLYHHKDINRQEKQNEMYSKI